jgi:hypothetical protein
MFTTLLKSLTLVTTALAVSVSAYGQSGRPIEFKIPFDFKAGKMQFPAGSYEVIASAANPVVLIRSTTGAARLMLFTNAVQGRRTQENNVLVFNRYGDRYFLSRVWPAGTDAGREAYTGPEEREIVRKSLYRADPVTASAPVSK